MAVGRGLNHVKADIKVAAARGDRDALRVLVDEFRRRSAALEQSRQNASETYDPTDGMSGLKKFHVGMAAGLTNVGQRAGQLLTPKEFEQDLGVSDQDIADREETDRALTSTGPGAAGKLLTEMAVTAPVGGGAGSAVRLGVGGLRAAGQGSRLARAAALAAEGAAAGELTSGNASEGALFNLGIGGTLAGARKLAEGARRTKEAQHLLDEGMDLTPGQMNPRGAMNQMESGAEHVPFLGAGVRTAREALPDQIMRKRLGDVTGRKIAESESIDDVMDEAYDGLRTQYNAFEQLPTVAGDGRKLHASLRKTLATQPVSEDAVNASARYLDNRFSSLLAKRPDVTVGDLIAMRSDMRGQARKMRKMQDLTAHERADVLDAAEADLTGIIDNALLPTEQQAMRALDAKYAQYKPIETAFVQHRTGSPTTRQQLSALKQTMSNGEFVNQTGVKGPTKRLLQNAISVQQGAATPTGIGYLFPTVGKYVSPVVAMTSGTRTGRRLFQGATGPQRALRRLGKTKAASEMARLLRAYRGGAAGAYSNDES